MATQIANKRIVTDGLVLSSDPGNPRITGAQDLTPNGNDGVLNGIASLKTGVWELSGSGNYIDFPHDPIYRFGGTDEFSVDLWLKLDNISNTQVIWSKGDIQGGTQNVNVLRSQSDGRITFVIQVKGLSTKTLQMKSEPALSFGVWHNVIATFDGSNSTTGMKLYFNGYLVDDTDEFTQGPVEAQDETGPMRLNSNAANGAAPISGYVGNLNVYNKELTDAEVLQNYNATKGRYNSEIRTGLRLGLNSRKNNAISSSTWFDISSEGKDATLVNMGSDSTTGFDGLDVNFDGTNDHIDYGDDSDFELSDYTIATWVKRSNSGSFDTIVNLQGQVTSVGGPSGVLLRYEDANDILFTQVISNTFEAITVTGSAGFSELDTWYHIVGTKSGTDIKLFVNGLARSTGSLSSATIDYSTTTSKRTQIGTSWDGLTSGGINVHYIGGSISNVKIFNRGLTEEEVLQEYNSTKHYF